MPVVNPGIRRLLASAIQRLLNSASFDAPLTHTAVPTRAATSTTATFTRATTKTWPNNDGYLVTGLAGEIGFPGARRVDNLIRLGAAQSSTLAVAANVTMTLPAGAYQFSMGAGTGRVTFSGTGGATGTLDAVTTGRVHVAKTITAGTLIVTASVATLVDIQVVSMVAETDQTTIREYVSVGVESAPYYHGSCVDGVKCFPTDLSGNPLTTMERYKSELAATQLIAATADIRDMTTASWTLGATMTRARTSVGWDGAANTATRLTGGTVSATNTITYTLVAAASSRTYSVGIKRITGTGPVRLTQDNFATSTDISSQLTTTGYTLVQLNQSQLNAVFGIKIDTNGDAIDVDMNQFESGTAGTSRILTGGATRDKDELTYTGGDIPNLKTLMAGFRREVGVSNVGVVTVLTAGTDANTAAAYLSNATASAFAGVVASVTQWSQVTSNAYTPETASKMVWSQATNDIKMAKDGIAQTQDTVAIVPASIALQIGHQNGAYQLNGNVGGIYGWTRNFSQSELNAVTA